jgi:ATP-dependent RNA helicase DDX52/ROK1
MQHLDHADDEAVASNQMTGLHSTRVTTKGSNIPNKIDSFEELRRLYLASNDLLENLKKSHYSRPTGIQSHGIPVLTQVS